MEKLLEELSKEVQRAREIADKFERLVKTAYEIELTKEMETGQAEKAKRISGTWVGDGHVL